MTIDPQSWEFPVEKLIPKRICLCLANFTGKIECIGFRIECEKLLLPDIMSGFEKEKEVKPNIEVDLTFPFGSLAALENEKAELGEPVEECPEDLGSIYLFGAHNLVGWQTISFGKIEDETIEVSFDLYFDFEYTGNIGGKFRHTISGVAEIEKRWEL